MPRTEARRMRIASNPSDLVAAHAVRRVPLVVASRATLDVAPGGIPVECPRAGQSPSRRMGIQRAHSRGHPLVLVAALARAGRVAALAGRRIRSRVDRVAPEEVLPVDE